ncbi:hypothetical protein FRC12_017873 [Ceratobasidium sp. 428]|nr:hypothetical protein FRC12_017873 [Ceratobasidium sp. 428]
MPTRKEQPDQHRRKRKLLYIPGVGAEAKGIPKYLAQVFGKTIVEMVIKAYMYISNNYRPGDNVCLFGYSRGAFVARKVAGLLHRIGIVGNETELLDQWKRREKPVPWDQVKDTPQSVPVRCIGLWDTVGAIYSSPDCEIKDLLGIPDAELSPNIQLALHVCAFHENRRRFRVTLFEPNPTTILKEVWFPGSHSDVGGGGEKPTQMPKLSLIWMIGELREFLEISDEKIRYPLLSKLEPLDAYNDSPAWKRVVDKYETRLDSQALKPTSKIHQTVQDIKQATANLHAHQHVLLTFSDLLSIRWNLRACLVACNRLELLKRKYIAEKDQKQTRDSSYQRRRITSVPTPPALPKLSIPNSARMMLGSPIAESPFEVKSADRPTLRRHNAMINRGNHDSRQFLA